MQKIYIFAVELPAWHDWQVADPSHCVYVPFGHRLHAELEICPSPEEYVPAGHL